MKYLCIAVIVVVCIAILWLYRGAETFTCNDCLGQTPRFGVGVINPFIWPNSGCYCTRGSGCAADVEETALSQEIYSQTTPDHVAQTN